MENNNITRWTLNSTNKTELAVLNESPPDTITYMVVKRVLLRLSLPSISKVKPHITNSTMVVAVLIATMAFQNTVNPAGGVWQDDKSPHKAGEAVIAYTHPHEYKIMVCANIVAFFSSIFTILFLAPGGPARHTCLLSIAFLAMCVSLASITVSYGASTLAINPNSKIKSRNLIALMLIIVSIAIAIATLFFLIRGIPIVLKIAKRNRRNLEDLRINHLP